MGSVKFQITKKEDPVFLALVFKEIIKTKKKLNSGILNASPKFVSDLNKAIDVVLPVKMGDDELEVISITGSSINIICKSNDRNFFKNNLETAFNKIYKNNGYKKTNTGGSLGRFEIVTELPNNNPANAPTDFNITFSFKDLDNGGGSGAGAEKTAQFECAQAATCQLLQDDSKVKEYKDFNTAKLSDKFVDRDLKKMQGVLSDESWKMSSWDSALVIKKHLDAKDYEFHRGVKTVKAIYDKLKSFKRRIVDGVELEFAIKEDKWNPADIWAFRKDLNQNSFISDLKQINTLVEYNIYFRKLFGGEQGQNLPKKVVGISLKKSKNPSLAIYDNLKQPNFSFIWENTVTNIPDLSGIYSYEKKGLFLSKDVYFEGHGAYEDKEDKSKKIRLQARSFNIGGNIQGELKGKWANQGKIGFGPLAKIFSTYMKFDEPKHIKNLSDDSLKLLLAELQQLRKIRSNDTDKINNSYTIENIRNELNTIKASKNSSESDDTKVRIDRLNSKYQGLCFANGISTAKEEERKNILSQAYLYASSQSNKLVESGPYIKVF